MYSNPPRPISRAASPLYGAPPQPQATPYPQAQPTSGWGQPSQPTPAYGQPAHQGYSAPTPVRPISRGPSPSPYMPQAPLPSNQPSGFQIERRAKSPNPFGRPPVAQPEPNYQQELSFRDHAANLIIAKNQQFATSGVIPCDPSSLTLFFRLPTGQGGLTHSIDFPIDTAHHVPPALEVLMTNCRPHQATAYDDYSSPGPALFFPPNQPLTTSLELANWPILDAVRVALFPSLPPGSYLSAVKDRLDLLNHGTHLDSHSPSRLANDGRAATIIVTLPVRYRGGDLVVRTSNGVEERFSNAAGKIGDIDWVAFTSEAEFGIERVIKGIRLSLSYGVHVKNLAPEGPLPSAALVPQAIEQPLVTPSDRFFDLLSPVLNASRGKSIGFTLVHDYGVNPAEVLANSIIPQLKGADALLYNAFKLHKLSPQLHFTAGGYVWAADRNLEFFGDGTTQPTGFNKPPAHSPGPYGRVASPSGFGGTSPRMPGGPGGYGYGNDETDSVRARVQASGAVTLADANITLITEWNNPSPPTGKEKVYFVSSGELEKLVVNVLLVVYIA